MDTVKNPLSKRAKVVLCTAVAIFYACVAVGSEWLPKAATELANNNANTLRIASN